MFDFPLSLVSDNRHLMSFKKYAIYRFREDQDEVGLEPNQSDGMDNCLDMLYKRLLTNLEILEFCSSFQYSTIQPFRVL